MNKWIYPSMLLFFLNGCAISPSLRGTAIYDSIRSVRTLVLYDPAFDPKDIQKVLSQSSDWMTDRFGIAIVPTEWRKFEWNRDKPFGEAYSAQEMRILPECECDIIIGFYKPRSLEYIVDNTFGGYYGFIDDEVRRCIVMKYLDWYMITHELIHAFVLNHEHDFHGILSPVMLPLPFTPLFARSQAVPESVRKEVMANKWRNFSKPITLGGI